MTTPDPQEAEGEASAGPKLQGDALGRLRSLASRKRASAEQLRKVFADLAQKIGAALDGASVGGVSENVVLETNGDDYEVYGFLSYGHGGLQVAYRSIEDDMADAVNPDPYGPQYDVESLSNCSPQWLAKLAAPTVLDSLLTDIASHIDRLHQSYSEGARVVASISEAPFRNLDRAIHESARRLDYRAVLEDWKGAQDAVGIDPAEAATRASRVLETLCRQILVDRQLAEPKTKDIRSLFKAATKGMQLSPDQQASDDLRTIASGLANIATGIGALRTHKGTAHGQDSRSQRLTEPEARLAVNAAGLLATFLMDVLGAREGPDTRDLREE